MISMELTCPTTVKVVRLSVLVPPVPAFSLKVILEPTGYVLLKNESSAISFCERGIVPSTSSKRLSFLGIDSMRTALSVPLMVTSLR